MTGPKIRYDVEATTSGQAEVNKLATELERLDDAVDPAAAARAQALAAELRKLGQQQEAINAFTALKQRTEAARGELELAQAAAQKLAKEISAAGVPTRAQAGQLEKLRDAVKSAKSALQEQTEQLDQSRGRLTQLGIASTELSSAQLRLRDGLRGAREEAQKLGQQSQALSGFRELVAATDKARQQYEAADAAVERFRRSIDATRGPTTSQAQSLDRLQQSARQAQQAFAAASGEQAKAANDLRAAGVSTERLAALQGRLPPALTATAAAARQAAAGYAQLGQAAGSSAASAATANQQVNAGLDGISRRLDALRNIGIAGILGSQTAQLLGSVGETADAFNNLRARIQLVTGEGPALEQALQGVEAIALRTGQSLENTGTLFTRVLTAGRELGLAQQDALLLTESINQSVAISGSSAAASDAAITQLIQGLQSGVLRGQEFNSVVEQAPRLAQALADGLGVTRGELRGLANDGKLSAQAVIQALQSQRETLEREFGQLPATIGRALENLRTKWTTFIGSLDASTGASATVAAGINGIAESLDELGAIAGRAGAVLVAALAIQGAGALRTLATQALATAGTMGVLSKSIADVPKVVNIAVAVTGFELGFQLGDMLRENSELARKFGVGVAEFFTGILNDLQFLKEAAAAIFTDDTIGQAFDRFKQRAQEQEAIFADLYREAEQAPSAVRAAAAAAAESTQQLGTVGQATAARLAEAGSIGAAGVGKVGQAADTAREAIVALATAAGVKLPALATTAAQQAVVMGDLAAKSREAAERIGREIPAAIAKLSGPELQRFRDTFVQAMDESARQSGLLNTVLAETSKRAAEALGVDLAQATNALSAEFVKAQENLKILIGGVDGLKAAGLDAGNVVTAALRKMANTADSQSEFAALRERVEALGKAGVITKDQMAELLDTIRGKAQEAAAGVDKLAQAYRQLGVQSQSELQRIAESSRKAWELIKNDASASLATKQAAFTRYAEAAVAANGGVASSTVQAEARALGLAVQAEKTGKAIVTSMSQAGSAVDRVADKFGEAGKKAADAAEQVNKWGERLNTTASGIGIPSGLSPSTLPPVNQVRTPGFTIETPPPDASGDWRWVPMLNKNAAGGEWRLTPEGLRRRSDAARRRRELGLPPAPFGTFQDPGDGSAPSPSPAPAPAPLPVPSPAPRPTVPGQGFELVQRFVRVEFILSGIGSAGGLASEQFADEFLELLERARRGGGG